MAKKYAHLVKESKVWDREFVDWDDILDNGILNCDEISNDDKAMHSIIRTADIIKEIFTLKLEKQFNLSMAQLNILECIYFSKREFLTQEEISKKVYCSKANASTIIARMDEKGLVVRKSNLKNKREKLVCLSDMGKNLLEEVFESFNKCQDDNGSIFSKSETDFIINKFKHLRSKLKSLK